MSTSPRADAIHVLSGEQTLPATMGGRHRGRIARRPNVLLICVDQWRGDALSIERHPIVHTPYIDGLASRGVRFTRAYSPSPTCVPARASLLTGTRPRTHGFVGFDHWTPWPYENTIAAAFTEAGYQTHAVGKMHVFPERARMGFERVVLHSALGIVREARRRGLSADDVDDYGPWLRQQLGRSDAEQCEHGLDSNSLIGRPWDKPESAHYTNFTAANTIEFLRGCEAIRRGRPFFLFTSFNAPHPPLDPPGWAFEMYRNRTMVDPVVGDWAERLFGQRKEPHHHAPSHGEFDPHVLQLARAGYYGHLTHIDHQVNRILEELRHLCLLERTYIVFVSDHGEMLGDHHCCGKTVPYEGSSRVPMILAGPEDSGVSRNATRDELVELADVMPTLLDCAGIAVPANVEGRSLLPLAKTQRDGALAWRSYLHGEHAADIGSYQWLTDGRWKYIWLSGPGTEQLFNLHYDPRELHDLALDPTHADTLGRWRQRLIHELRDFEEGYVQDGQLVPGRSARVLLSHLREAAARIPVPAWASDTVDSG